MVCIVIKNELGLNLGEFPIDTRKDLAKETARILLEENIVLNEGDTITIERR